MPLDAARYHPWHGRRRPAAFAAFAVARTTLLQLVRRRAYWIVLALGLVMFFVYASVIYMLTQMQLPPRTQEFMFARFNFSPTAGDPQETGYVTFMESQGMIVMILLALAGSLVVGSDFRVGALPFYLSRSISRRHYLVGKLLAIMVVVWSLTVLPALVLFIEYGLFTTSFDYWLEHWQIVPAILGYGLVLGTVLSIWIAALAAYLQRLAPIAVTWSSLFVLPARLAYTLRNSTNDRRWLLLDPWRDIRLAGRMFFGNFESDSDRQLSQYAAIILAAVTVPLLIALVRRVRAVEVVA